MKAPDGGCKAERACRNDSQTSDGRDSMSVVVKHRPERQHRLQSAEQSAFMRGGAAQQRGMKACVISSKRGFRVSISKNKYNIIHIMLYFKYAVVLL